MLIAIFLCGCTTINTGGGKAIDTVMQEGMTISIDNPHCFSLTVTAGEGLERYYTWNGGTRSWTLIPRTEKWNGVFGAYSPGDDFQWEKHDGINRILAEEAVVNYENYDQLFCALSPIENNCREKYYGYTVGKITTDDIMKMDFKNTLPSAFHPDDCSAYTDDGLYVAVKKADGPGDGGTLSVIVHLFKVAGKPVKGLPGSSNDRIKITYPKATHRGRVSILQGGQKGTFYSPPVK